MGSEASNRFCLYTMATWKSVEIAEQGVEMEKQVWIKVCN